MKIKFTFGGDGLREDWIGHKDNNILLLYKFRRLFLAADGWLYAKFALNIPVVFSFFNGFSFVVYFFAFAKAYLQFKPAIVS